MKKRKTPTPFLATLVLLLIVSAVFYFKEHHKPKDVTPDKPVEPFVEDSYQSSKKTKHTEPNSVYNFQSSGTDPEIIEFNQLLSTRPQLNLLMDENDEINQFLAQPQVTKSSSKQLIEKMLANVEEHQLSVRQLFLRCNKLKNEFDKYNSDSELIYSNDILIRSMLESKVCLRLGRKNDPFFTFLALARSGDYVSQLFLIDDLSYAIRSGAVNPSVWPLEYNDLRQEAKQYLEILSSRGVAMASRRLILLYGSGRFFPKEPVKEYFYTRLAVKQNTFGDSIDLLQMADYFYEGLTAKEKERAERMLSRIR